MARVKLDPIRTRTQKNSIIKWKWYIWDWVWAGPECIGKFVRATNPEPRAFTTVAQEVFPQLIPMATWRGSLMTRSLKRKKGQASFMDYLLIYGTSQKNDGFYRVPLTNGSKRECSGEILPMYRTLGLYDVWKEKWPNIRILIDSWEVANGLPGRSGA